MKILYLITYADLGGAQKYVLSLADRSKGIIAAGDEALDLFEQAKKLNIETYRLRHLKRKINFFTDLLATWEIYSLLKKIQPDIIHLNSTKIGFLGSLAGKIYGCRIVYTAHGFAFHEPNSRLRRWYLLSAEKFASSFRDFTIAVSELDYQSALKYKLAKPGSIKLIHNGIARINFSDKISARKKLDLPDGKFIVGSIANFYKNKGIDILVQAVSKVTKSNTLFVVIGEGPLKENIKQKIQNLNLSNFLLRDKVVDAAVYLKAFDIFVLPSRKEGFPFALLEALQANLPIVATDVGGNKEALDNCGLLVPPENSDELAGAIEKLLNDESLRHQVTKNAQRQAEKFTLENMYEETQAVYTLNSPL